MSGRSSGRRSTCIGRWGRACSNPCTTPLAHELGLRGVRYIAQAAVPVVYKGIALARGYRVDLIIEGTLLVELKTVDRILPIHQAQMLTYLKLLDLPQALLINFNATQLREGLKSFLHTPGTSMVADDGSSPGEAPASGRES